MDLRKSNSYVSCIKIRGVPIIPPLMTDVIRAEMQYYKGLALAVQKRLTWLEKSADFSVCALTPPVLAGSGGLSRAADSLDGNADGETDYPDETGPCGSESPDVTTDSVDLTPGCPDVTENTNVDSYLADMASAESSTDKSTEQSQEKSARKIEEQRRVQQCEKVAAKQNEKIETQYRTQESEKIKPQHRWQRSEEKMETQHSGHHRSEKLETQGSAQQSEEKFEGQHSANQSPENIKAQRRTQRYGERMEAQHSLQQSAKKIEALGRAQAKEEEIEARCSEQKSEERIDAEHSMLQNAEKINAQHSRQRSEEQIEAQHSNQQCKVMEAQHIAQRIETIELLHATQQTEKMGAQRTAQQTEKMTACRTAQQAEKIVAQLGTQQTANKTEPQHRTQQIPEQRVPEFRRAQVPKSLNIMPITLEATPSSQLEPIPVHDMATPTSTTESALSTPKLVRQGSYVLETPSPMLLARMRQVGERSPVEYAPTSRAAPRRRAWNISEARSSWELQDNKDTLSENLKQTRTTPHKRRVVGSADCIISMVYRESRTCPTKPTGNPGQCGRRNVTRNGTSILAMANKLGGSLGNLGRRRTGSRASQSADDVVASNRENFRTTKLLAAVTTEKVLEIFEQIRSTHEQQMSQLLTRQRREQRDMQREFETQTKILVSQIERTFPSVRLPEMTSRIAESSTSPETDKNEPDGGLTLKRDRKFNGFSPKDDTARCPLNGILPFQETPNRGLAGDDLDDDQRRNDRRASRRLFPVNNDTIIAYGERHVKAATVINAYARGYLVRRIMRTERVLALRTTYVEALRCMLRLHVDAPLALPELNFHQRLQLQCDAASMNIVELFAQEPAQRVKILKQDREVKRSHRQERPNSARSCYSFATQRTLARKKLKEMADFQTQRDGRSVVARSRCQTWTSNARPKRSLSVINQGIKRSTSTGAVRKPWR